MNLNIFMVQVYVYFDLKSVLPPLTSNPVSNSNPNDCQYVITGTAKIAIIVQFHNHITGNAKISANAPIAMRAKTSPPINSAMAVIIVFILFDFNL